MTVRPTYFGKHQRFRIRKQVGWSLYNSELHIGRQTMTSVPVAKLLRLMTFFLKDHYHLSLSLKKMSHSKVELVM